MFDPPEMGNLMTSGKVPSLGTPWRSEEDYFGAQNVWPFSGTGRNFSIKRNGVRLAI